MVPFLDTNTPARVHRPSGTIFINGAVWNNFNDDEKKIIIEHEIGHYQLQTADELEADNYALEKNAGKFDQSLRTSVNLLHRALDLSKEQNQIRFLANAKHAIEIDQKKFGNKNLDSVIQLINEMYPKEQTVENYILKRKDEFLFHKGIASLSGLSSEIIDNLFAEFVVLPDILAVVGGIDLIESQKNNFFGTIFSAAVGVVSSVFKQEKGRKEAIQTANALLEEEKLKQANLRLKTANTETEKIIGLPKPLFLGLIGVSALILIFVIIKIKRK